MPPVLSAAGIAKRFDATVALSAPNLSIDAGEVVALMGANGVGKSTFVKILGGVLRPGRRHADAARPKPYRPASPHAAKWLGIASVQQSVAGAVNRRQPVARPAVRSGVTVACDFGCSAAHGATAR
nr:ATP-binding cassette domain-containing protein [Burkholderia sp. FL-7-2-10-S1-D7]